MLLCKMGHQFLEAHYRADLDIFFSMALFIIKRLPVNTLLYWWLNYDLFLFIPFPTDYVRHFGHVNPILNNSCFQTIVKFKFNFYVILSYSFFFLQQFSCHSGQLVHYYASSKCRLTKTSLISFNFGHFQPCFPQEGLFSKAHFMAFLLLFVLFQRLVAHFGYLANFSALRMWQIMFFFFIIFILSLSYYWFTYIILPSHFFFRRESFFKVHSFLLLCYNYCYHIFMIVWIKVEIIIVHDICRLE